LTDPGTLLIRADASPAIGAGHVMRCLALAQAWQDTGGTALLAAYELPSWLETRLAAEKVGVAHLRSVSGTDDDARELLELSRQIAASWVVLDGEHLGAAYIKILKRHSRFRILWLDDFGTPNQNEADLILNQNIGVTSDWYPSWGPKAKLLLGTRYVLLRREFRSHAPVLRETGASLRLLLTFGGSDPDNLTEKVLQAFTEGPPEVHVTAVVSSRHPRLTQLRRLAGSIRADLLVDVTDMADLMMRSDMAIIVGGGTLWELLYSGCVVLSYSRNSPQSKAVALLAASGAAVDLGPVAGFEAVRLREEIRRWAIGEPERNLMQAAAKQIVDGNGVARVLRELNGE
jgi:UDP-2,4-diacetamido-2,4,6-trideoxy-beta-L-altropyranose hydrolase